MSFIRKSRLVSRCSLLGAICILGMGCGSRISSAERWELQALEAEKSGDWGKAFECYGQSAQSDESASLKAAALRHQVEMLLKLNKIDDAAQLVKKIEQTGDINQASMAMLMLSASCEWLQTQIPKACDTPAADRLLERWTQNCLDEAMLASFGRMEGRCAGQALWLASQRHQGQQKEAELQALLERPSDDPFWDDAAWSLAQFYVENQDLKKAVDVALRLVFERGQNRWPNMGSERSDLTDDALFLAACVEWEDLKNAPRARILFQQLVSEMPGSVWADDALWFWSQSEPDPKKIQQKLSKNYPESSYLNVTPDSKPKSCHLWNR